MTNSSQPKNSSEDLIINDTIDLSGITLIGSDNSYDYLSSGDTMITINSTGAACDTISIGSLDIGTITINGSGTDFIFNENRIEWSDSFPDWDRVQDMCLKYPGLKVAFDNFKIFYEMIKDDYDTPKDQK